MNLDNFEGEEPDIEYNKILSEYYKKVDELIDIISQYPIKADPIDAHTLVDLLVLAVKLKFIVHDEPKTAKVFFSDFGALLSQSEGLLNKDYGEVETLFREIYLVYLNLERIKKDETNKFLIKDCLLIIDFFNHFNSIFGTSFQALPVAIQQLYDDLASLQPEGSMHNITIIISFLYLVSFVLDEHNAPIHDGLKDLLRFIQVLLADIIRQNIAVGFSQN